MKRKNKFIDNLSENQNSNKDIEKNDYSFQDTKKKNIINDLKEKGFNEIQIDDILETLIRNSISDRAPKIEEHNIQETHTIDTDMTYDDKIGNKHKKNKKMEYINNNSKYKNSFIIKTENSETKKNNKNKSEYNCAKIYINASTEKDREFYLDSSENIDEKKNNGKILNFKKYRHVPHITTQKNYLYTNSFNNKKITKFENFLNKFCSQYRNNTNRTEVNRKEMLKKFENEINDNFKNQRNILYNNYNFKMIFDSKKFKDKDKTENIGYVEIKNNSSRDMNNPLRKSRNSNNEENKNNNSNSFSIKQKILSSINQVSFDLNEIKEEKENNENNKDSKDNEIKDYKNKDKNTKIKNSNDIEKEEKNNKKRNKGKYIAMKKNKMNKDKKSKQDNLSNKFINTKKIFSYSNNNNGKKEIPLGKNNKNNVFMIRKQKTEEEEKLAKKNIAIVEIKQNDQKLSRNNNNLIYEKNNKSKSLSKINNIEIGKNNIKNFEMNDDFKRSQSNFNHTFVNINLCKGNIKNCSTFYKNRGYTIKENSNTKIMKNHSHKEEKGKNLNIKIKSSFENLSIISNDNEKNLIYNKLNKAHTIVNTDNNNSDNNNNLKKINHILFTSYNLKGKKTYDEEEVKNKSNIDKLNDKIIKTIDTKKYINIKIEDNLKIYFKKIKKYENGIYEGIMLNDKREIKGTMIYSNGAKYEGQWRNDKKNGKGIFTSSHYFNCKYKVGMKYEGEFKDDKFDGYGITSYTNGDKFEGEWKNNKQYGKGVVSYFDGSKYDGEWKDGKFDGIGIFYLKNGERFEGKFFDNKYNGYGKYYYNNGDYLEGIFKNDLPRGNCFLHKSDGTTVNVQH